MEILHIFNLCKIKRRSKFGCSKIEIFSLAASHICVLLIQTLELDAPIGTYIQIINCYFSIMTRSLRKSFSVVYFWRALELGPRSTAEEYTRGVMEAMREDGLIPLMRKK